MILADTSIWIEHFRRGHSELQSLLHANEVLTHPFIVGELAFGALQNRAEILHHLKALPEARQADHHEVLLLIEKERLHGRGLGWIDVHLLASALLSGCRLWTLDKPLIAAAKALKISL
jgi:predicted nucleic acid-binding protein